MSSFLLKIVACITMFIDHIGYLVNHGKTSIYNFIGRIAFPIFAFQISEGYIHTKNFKKYMLRLFIFAIISQYPFMLFHRLIAYGFALNVFFTLFLGLICIFIYDKCFNGLSKSPTPTRLKIICQNIFALAVCIGIAFIAEITHCDYGAFGVIVIWFFFVFKDKPFLMNIAFILSTAIKYSTRIVKYGYANYYCLMFLCTVSSLVFINLYNKKQGKKIKYFLYIFYPAHLLLIWFLWNTICV